MEEMLQVDSYDVEFCLLVWWTSWFALGGIIFVIKCMAKELKIDYKSPFRADQMWKKALTSVFLIWLSGLVSFKIMKMSVILWLKFTA